jgi:large subunit ribosomal protein L5
MNVLKEKYTQKIRPDLKKKLSLKSVMQVPRIEKVVLSMCVPQAVKNPKILNTVQEDLSLIAGQKAIITKAKKAVSNFKIKKGMLLGSCVTLRRDKMWTFLERLIHFSLPQVRDFRGLSPRSFDGHGNYSIGIKEQIIFPEVDYDKVDAIRGMNITICTTAKTDEEARALLEHLGMPFRKK